jgi:hypothetical protein
MEGEIRVHDIVADEAELLCMGDSTDKTLDGQGVLGTAVDVALVSPMA